MQTAQSAILLKHSAAQTIVLCERSELRNKTAKEDVIIEELRDEAINDSSSQWQVLDIDFRKRPYRQSFADFEQFNT
jgi:hypothetical protein